jgi:hypothetical protein
MFLGLMALNPDPLATSTGPDPAPAPAPDPILISEKC